MTRIHRFLFTDEAGEYAVSSVAGMGLVVVPLALAVFLGQQVLSQLYAKVVAAAAWPFP